MRLIDADALIDTLGVSDEDINFREVLDSAPSIDIVRCCECKYASDYGTYGCMCEHFNDTSDAYHRMWSDDFCSRGERNRSEKPNKSEIPTGSERSRR